MARACGMTSETSENGERVSVKLRRNGVAWKQLMTQQWPEWTWQLTSEQCRCLIAGMQLAQCNNSNKSSSSSNGSKVIEVSSTMVREAMMRVMLHAGYTTTFERVSESIWRVEYSSEESEATCEPLLVRRKCEHNGGSAITEDVMRQLAPYAGRTWCFDMNDGFVVVRRALRTVDGVVTRASRATIQGNVSGCIVFDMK